MILTTTSNVEGRPVAEYLGIVTGEVIVGANVFKDIFASVRDIVGGRSAAYEDSVRGAREDAIAEAVQEATRRGANALIGVDIDYEILGKSGSMMMVSVSGTAVRLR